MNFFCKSILVLLFIFTSVHARDFLLEVKGAGFIPTSHLYKKIYRSSGIFGVEFTGNLWCDIYGWASVDGLSKHGYSLIGHDRTKVSYVPIAFGLKYFSHFVVGIGMWVSGR